METTQAVPGEEQGTKEIKTYQLTYILPATVASGELLKRHNELVTALTEKGVHITESRDPARTKFAYPMAKQMYGFMGEIKFWTDPEAILGLLDVLRHEENILRFLITKEERRRRAPVRFAARDAEKPRPAREKISIQEIDKKLDEIMKSAGD